jgi:hypothetical protein
MLAGVVFARVLFWLPITFFLAGVSPSTQFEESVGYRYFYSMRNVYGGEFPWVPQGHLPALCHRALQYVLDWLRFPRTDLTARVATFSFFAVLVPLLLSAALAGMVFWQSRLRPFVMIGTFGSAVILLLPGTPNGWTVMPDYHVWLVPIALNALLLSTQDHKRHPETHALLFGAFSAFALTTKLSFLAFALPVLGTVIDRMRQTRRVGPCVLASLVGFGGVLVFILVLYFPDWNTVTVAGEQLRIFLGTQSGTLPVDLSVSEALRSEPYLLVVITLQLILAVCALVWRRLDALGLAVGAFLLIVFVGTRFYSHSLIELHAYLFLEVAMLISWASRAGGFGQERWAIIFALGALGLTVTLGRNALWYGPISLLEHSRTLQQLADEFDGRLRARSESIWVLTTGNAYRPNSVHSALCKGGTDIFRPYWGASHYVADLFPNFHCAVVPDGVRQQELTNSSVGFLRYPNESVGTAVKRVEDYFQVSLNSRNCTDVPADAFGYVVCDPPQLPVSR